MNLTITLNNLAKKPNALAAVVDSRVRWNNIAPSLLMIFTVGVLDKSGLSIVIADPRFLNELNLNHQQILLGWLTTGLTIAYGIAAPAWGWLICSIGARRTIMVSIVLWFVVCIMSGLSASYGMLLTARIVLGISEAALYPFILSLVAHWFPLKERGRATAFWWIGGMIAPMLTGLLVTGLIVSFGWRVQFYALGALAIIMPLPMAFFLLRDNPREHPRVSATELDIIESGRIEANEDAPGRILRTKVSSWYRNYRYWLIVTAIVFNTVFYWGWSVWLPTYLKTTRHYSFSQAGYLTFVIYGAATLTIIGIGFFSDRIFCRASIAGLGWISSGGFLLAATMVADRTACVVFMTLALCAQQTGVVGAHMLYHSVVSTGEMAKSQGYATALVQILGAFSPVMIGYLLKVFAGDFTVAFAILAGAVFIAAGCMAVLAKEGL
jgi:sugar phosphate permease